MRVVICLDNKEKSVDLRNQIHEVAKTKHAEINVEACSSSDGLFFRVEEDPNLEDLIVLDTNIDGEDGIAIAAKLRNIGYRNDLIFITDEEKPVFRSFDTDPVSYILSHNKEEYFAEAFERSQLRNERKKAKYFLVKRKGETKKINLADIRYIKANKRIKTIYYGKDNTFEIAIPLERLNEMLWNKGFVRLHKGVIANINQIASFTMDYVTLRSGEKLSVGVRYHKQVRDVVKKAGIKIN